MIDWNKISLLTEEQKQQLLSEKWYRDELTKSLHSHFLSCEGLEQEDKQNKSLLNFESKTSIRSHVEKLIREDFLTTEDTKFISLIEKCIKNSTNYKPLSIEDLNIALTTMGNVKIYNSQVDLLINTIQKQINKSENIEHLIDSELTDFLEKSIIVKGKSIYVISDKKLKSCLKKIEEWQNAKK